MVYIQSDTDRTRPHHFDCSCAMFGAIETADDYRFKTFEDVTSGSCDALIKRNLFVGSVEFMRAVFERVDLKNVGLERNSNRPFEITTLAEARELSLHKKIFIKPIEQKLFTGLVLEGFQYSDLKSIPDDTKVLVYDAFDSRIVSEWRTYILRGKVEYMANYSGDLFHYPDPTFVEMRLEENHDMPESYTMDIGILEDGNNVVIEFNDMWAIGNYGMPNDMYLKCLSARYIEILRTTFFI